MKRFLIFLFLFPAIATASFYVMIYILSSAEIDSLSGPALGYLIFIGPGLVVALVDWLLARTPIPAVTGTTLFAYAATVLLAQMDWGRGLDKAMLALGLVGAIPAAVCSLLSGARMFEPTGESHVSFEAKEMVDAIKEFRRQTGCDLKRAVGR